MAQSSEEISLSARLRAMWSNGRGALRNYSEFTLIGTIVVLIIVGATALRTPPTVTKTIEVSKPADVARIKQLEADNERFLSELKVKSEQLKTADSNIDQLKVEGTKSLAVVANLVDTDMLARHLLTMKRQHTASAGFGPLWARAFYSATESMGFGSWFKNEVLDAGKTVLFEDGAANLLRFVDTELGRQVILKMAQSYRQDLALFAKYPKLLASFDPQSAVSTQTGGAPSIGEAQERFGKYYDMQEATAYELGNAEWFVQFLRRRYDERQDGDRVVAALLQLARWVMTEVDVKVDSGQQIEVQPAVIVIPNGGTAWPAPVRRY